MSNGAALIAPGSTRLPRVRQTSTLDVRTEVLLYTQPAELTALTGG
jgi:hypothetical protein